MAQYFPEKPTETAGIDEEIKYTQDLVAALADRLKNKAAQKLKDRLLEMLKSDKVKDIQSGYDCEAKVGHKSVDTSFFGYKNHIALSDEGFITGLEVSPGQEADTTKLQNLIQQTEKNGIEVKEVIGDTAYSSKGNLDYCEEREIKLLSRVNPIVTDGKPKKEGFIYNKDAGMLQCPEGHLAIKCTIRKGKTGSKSYIYWFSVRKCKKCPRYGTCCKDGARRKSCCVTVASATHQKQFKFEQTDYFRERIKDRYKIEAKNAELKQAHGLGRCKYVGLRGMRLQAYFTAFVANVKRIIRLKEIKAAI